MSTEKSNAFTARYPGTKKSEHTDIYFGTVVADPYHWLEDDMSLETKNWVDEQNTVTSAYINQIPFRKKILERLTGLWNYEKFSAPFKEGIYTYFYKNDGLQNQAVLYRQQEDGEPEVFLNPNDFSDDGTTSLAGIDFSKNGSKAAYQLSEGGSDWRKVLVINAITGKHYDDTLSDVKFTGLSWKGNEGFFYSSYEKPKDGSELSGKTAFHKLFFHKLGTQQTEDKLVFGGEQTRRRYIGGGVTEDQHFLVISASNATYGNELYIQDLNQKDAPIIPLATGFNNEHEVIFSDNGKLFILTNLEAPNRKLVVVNNGDPKIENWVTLIAEDKFPLMVTTAGKKLFAQYLKNAVSDVQQYSLDGEPEKTIPLPGPGTAAGFSGKMDEQFVYYSFTSYVFPSTIFKYDINTGQSELYKKSSVKFNPEDFESKQVFYSSKDGTKLPMIITYKKGIQYHGKNPLMLYGYGGFGVSLTPVFDISNIILLDNGGVYAVPNLRGGGEYGDAWHNAGIKMKKQNVFDDFIAAADYLITNGYTSKEFLAIAGASNGGLLVGAVMTQRPELFRVAFPSVGVLDMLRYHKFTAGAGWAYDYGTADDNEEMFKYLLAYSPVQNVRYGICYPATLITTADHDDRVVPAHSFKYAAQLQDKQSGENPVLISIQVKAGHGAGKPTLKIIEENADEWAFMFFNMGIDF